MARKIILKEDGLAGSGTAPSGYKYLGDSSGDISEKVGATVSAIGGSTATTTVVNISSAQILSMGGTAVSLLPAPGVGKYYDIEKFIFEYSFGTTPYVFSGTDRYLKVYNTDEYFIIPIQEYFLQETSDVVSIFGFNTLKGSTGDTWDSIPNGYYPLNQAFFLNASQGDAFTEGDGTLRVIITYTVRTFGA